MLLQKIFHKIKQYGIINELIKAIVNSGQNCVKIAPVTIINTIPESCIDVVKMNDEPIKK